MSFAVLSTRKCVSMSFSFIASFRDNGGPNARTETSGAKEEEPSQMCLRNYNPREDYVSDSDAGC